MQDIRRIAFVSQRYFELQGLGPALCGAGMILGSLTLHLAGNISSPAAFWPFMVANMFGGATPYLQRSYRRSFGTAVGTRLQQFAAGLPQLLVMAGGVADMFLQFAGRFAPSVAAIALASSSSMIVLRDGRWRVHHVAGIVAGVAGAVVTTVIPHTVDRWGDIGPVRVEAYLLAYTIVGLGLIATGLLDHHLLTSFLRPAVATESARVDEAAVHARLPTPAAFAILSCLFFGGFAWAVDAPILLVLLPPLIIMSAQFARAIGDVRRATRAIARGERVPEPKAGDLNLPADVLGSFFVVATAAAVDSAVFPHRAPLALMASTALMTAWLVARDWRHRRHYAPVPVAAALSLASALTLDPSRAFALFIAGISGGLAIAWILDAAGMKMRRV